VQKDTPTNGKEACVGNLSDVENQDHECSYQNCRTKQEIEKKSNNRVDAVLVDHDQVSSQLVGNLVDNGGNDNRVSEGGSASDVGGSDKDSVGEVVDGLTKIKGNKQREVLEAEAFADCNVFVVISFGHIGCSFLEFVIGIPGLIGVGLLGIACGNFGSIRVGNLGVVIGIVNRDEWSVDVSMAVGFGMGEECVKQDGDKESTHNRGTPSPGGGSFVSSLVVTSQSSVMVIVVSHIHAVKHVEGFRNQQEKSRGHETSTGKHRNNDINP
jgi:hypothetical protein